MAAAFCAITRRDGPGAVAEAVHGRFEMLLMRDLFEMEDAPALKPEEWQRLCRAVTGVVANRRHVEAMREELERKAAEAAEAMEGLDPQEKMRRIAERVREIFGMPPLPYPRPEAAPSRMDFEG